MARPSYKSREVAAEPSAVIRSLDQEQAQASNSRQFKTRITHNPSCYVSSEQMNRAPWNDSKSTGFSQDKMGPQDPIVFGNVDTDNQERHKARKEPRYICSRTTPVKRIVCGMRFLERADLQRHHESYHSIETVSKQNCPSEKCNRKGERGFRRQSELTGHIRRCHPTLVASHTDGIRGPGSKNPLPRPSAKSLEARLPSVNGTPLSQPKSMSNRLHNSTQALASMTLDVPAPKQLRCNANGGDSSVEARPSMVKRKPAMHVFITEAEHPSSALHERTTSVLQSNQTANSTGPTTVCRTPVEEFRACLPEEPLMKNQLTLFTSMTLPYRPRSYSSSTRSVWSTDSEVEDDHCEDESVSGYHQDFASGDNCLNRRFFNDVMKQACGRVNQLFSGSTYAAQDAEQSRAPASSQQHELTSSTTVRACGASNLKTGRGLTRLPTEPDRDDNDGQDDKERDREPAARVPVPTGGLNFACPFFKHNPNKYTKCRAIENNEVRRIKAHIYARHKKPYCERSKIICVSDAAVTEHLDQPEECQRRDFPKDFDSITKFQVKILRDKKNLAPTEEDRWKDVYQTIFRPDHKSDVPCPYATMSREQYEHLTVFKDVLLQKIPNDMISRLEPQAGHLGDAFQALQIPIKQAVLGAVTEIYQAYLLSSPDSEIKVPTSSQPELIEKVPISNRRDRLSTGSSSFSRTSPHTPRSERSHSRRRSRSPNDVTPIRPAPKRPRIQTTNIRSSPYLQVAASPGSFNYSDYTTSSVGDGSFGVVSRKTSMDFAPPSFNEPSLATVRENLTGIVAEAGMAPLESTESYPGIYNRTDLPEAFMQDTTDFNMQNEYLNNGWDGILNQDYNRELDAAAAYDQHTTNLQHDEAYVSQPMTGTQASPQSPETPQILITPGTQPLPQLSWSTMNMRNYL